VRNSSKTDLQILDGLLKNYDRRATPPSTDKGEENIPWEDSAVFLENNIQYEWALLNIVLFKT
jgi:hypothetical protein